jgi:hypothetical protein
VVRKEYTIALEGLASHGYFVVAMDHTYDGSAVEFLDGSIPAALGINGDAQAIGVRTKDNSLVIDQLLNSSFIEQISGIGHDNFKGSKIAVFGHSLSGTTTLSILENDKRVLTVHSVPFLAVWIPQAPKSHSSILAEKPHPSDRSGFWGGLEQSQRVKKQT